MSGFFTKPSMFGTPTICFHIAGNSDDKERNQKTEPTILDILQKKNTVLRYRKHQEKEKTKRPRVFFFFLVGGGGG